MANARHSKAGGFVRQNLFAGLASFAELEQRIASLPDEKARGDAFEVFTEAYLATQRKHDAETVWPFGSAPTDLLTALKLGTQDYGIDGLLKTRLGQHSVYQVKFRTGRPSLTWREISTFTGLADSPAIHSRILFTNCDDLPAVLNDRQGFFCIRGTDLDRLEAADFQTIATWLADAAFVAAKKTPLPHQAEALEKILPALNENPRVTAIMACGTGKTLVALWTAESVARSVVSREATDRKLASYEVAGNAPVNSIRPEGTPDFHRPVRTESDSGTTPDTACLANFQSPVGTNDASIPTAKILVLLPSLALLRQTLHEWLRETNLPALAYLCVCSDATVKDGTDALHTQQSDLDFEVSTDAASVRRFLDADFAGVKLVFSTYQSASVVGEAMQAGAPISKSAGATTTSQRAEPEFGAPNCPPREWFDLGIFDEAHKTSGREGRNFAFALEDKNLSIRKRLFLTATPRHYNPQKRDKEGEAELVFSMNRPEVYGPQAYVLTFAEAARRKIICGYKVIISVITSQQVTNELLARGEVLVAGETVDARQVANQIALRDAVTRYGVRRIFTFHRTVKDAESFVSAGPQGVGTHLNGDGRAVLPHRPDSSEQAAQQRGPTKHFQTFHVNGKMPAAHRERLMREFRACDHGLMSNARCLTEGVDVPAVDMVAFLSPRRSLVDIVQATGRAMRKADGKELGYVLVPLFVEQEQGESVEAAVARAEFSEVWDVLQSLQEQDEVLADAIREIGERKGQGKDIDNCLGGRIEFNGTQIDLGTLRTHVAAKCLEQIGSTWDVYFGKLMAFKDRFGHCRVTTGWPEDPSLWSWVSSQRNRHHNGILFPEQFRRLNEVGFVWDWQSVRADEIWDEWYLKLKAFKEKNGHCRATRNSIVGWWVAKQRNDFRDRLLTAERIEKLNLIGFEWKLRNRGRGDTRIDELKAFKAEHGHCRVPIAYPKYPGLGTWCSLQRFLFKSGNLPLERKEQLAGLGFWAEAPQMLNSKRKWFGVGCAFCPT